MTIDTPRPSLLFVCTGNATRSVIAGELARRALPGARVATAGTFVVEGQVTSWRTRAAMDAIGITAPHHRSTQLTGEHLRDADLVVVGNRGLNSLAGRILGSVPANLSHRSPCDVLIVHTTPKGR